MKEQLVSFETAKLAKEKGFNIRIVARYGKGKSEKKVRLHESNTDYDSECNIEWDWNNNSGNGIASPYPNEELRGQCSAPTQNFLIQWLREKHNIHLVPDLKWIKNGWTLDAYSTIDSSQLFTVRGYQKYKNYEEVLEIGLQEAF